ncbi:MAG: hypothetical protein U0228_10880 [Myxococcaceae bacterium]
MTGSVSRVALVLVFLASLLWSGCRKHTWQPYYQLDGQQQVLVARDGDSGYLSDEMAEVIAALRAAPENTREHDQALALAARLEAERARVTAERKRDTPVAVVPTAATPPALDPPKPPPPPDEGVDAATAPTEPFQGMTEEEFVKAFGACFSSGPADHGPDGGVATSQLVKNTPECRKRWGKPEGETAWLFLKEGGLLGSRTTVTTTTTVVVDAGPPPPPPAPDPSKVIRLMPGQPLPEGYTAVPPPDAG